MFSRIARGERGTAAWRISLWSSIAFAVGTAIAFWFLQQFLANEIQNRADSWLTGELGVLADVAERTPPNRVHDIVIREVAELASREVPHDEAGAGAMDRAVFFVQIGRDGELKLHTGAGASDSVAEAISRSDLSVDKPVDLAIPGFNVPFRVAEATVTDGDRIYLALSSRHEREVLHRLRIDFTTLWFTIIALGSSIVYISTRRMLDRIQAITETAETIGRTNLTSRVPVAKTNDEISRLSSTLNRMLDRVETSVQQLHALSDALAHDLRSPMTSLRGKLELALLSEEHGERDSSIGQCIEQVDRLSALLNTSLDLSEASADALRIKKEPLDIRGTLLSLAALYEPAFSQVGLTLRVQGKGPTYVNADHALMQRLVSNLLDNELKHLPPGKTVLVAIEERASSIRLVTEDDGDGFPPDLLPHVFDRYAKGPASSGFGLGLAFVSAVVRSHDGSAIAENRPEGGARITIELPVSLESELA